MNKRSSNMECLRITAMLMIIAYHIFYHCINIQLTDANAILASGNDWYCQPHFSKKLCILAVISPMGSVANAIFILISGYFMAGKESIDLTKISKKLLLQLGFATFVLGFVSICVYRNITQVHIKLISFNAFNYSSWYVGYYFIVIVIAKLFLNKFLHNLDSKKWVMFMMALFSLAQFSWSNSIISNVGVGLETICTGVFLYSLGGYVKKYNPFASIRLWALLTIIIISNLFVIANYYITTADNILSFNPNSGKMFMQSIPLYGNNQIIPIVLGVAVFELFRRIKVPNSKIVNFIGTSTFMVYLFHDNAFFYKIWNIKNWIELIHENIAQFCGTYLWWVIKTFAAGILCYTTFVVVSKIFSKCKGLVVRQKYDEGKGNKPKNI